MSRTNFTPEDKSITRADIQAFLDEGREKDSKGKLKPSKKTPADVKQMLKNKGQDDDQADKLIGDLDSYL